jgi:hypothetical protein
VVGHLKLRLLVCAALVGLTALWASSVATATTVTDSTDPNVTVTATLKSNNRLSPDIAVNGNWVTASVSVRSNMAELSYLNVFLNGQIEGTQWMYETSILRQFRPDKAYTRTISFPIFGFMPRGVYSLSVMAVSPDSFDISSATATLTVQ